MEVLRVQSQNFQPKNSIPFSKKETCFISSDCDEYMKIDESIPYS